MPNLTDLDRFQVECNLRRLRELAAEHERLTGDRLHAARLRSLVAEMEAHLANPRRVEMPQ